MRSGDGEPKAIVKLLAFGGLLACVLALGPYERYAHAAGYELPLPALLYASSSPAWRAAQHWPLRGLRRGHIAPLTELAARRLLDRVNAPRRTHRTPRCF